LGHCQPGYDDGRHGLLATHCEGVYVAERNIRGLVQSGVRLDRGLDAITDIGSVEIGRSQQALWKSGNLAAEWARAST
jgi:hypothetical protein